MANSNALVSSTATGDSAVPDVTCNRLAPVPRLDTSHFTAIEMEKFDALFQYLKRMRNPCMWQKGLNADLLDGQHASYFATADHNHDTDYAALSHNHDSDYVQLDDADYKNRLRILTFKLTAATIVAKGSTTTASINSTLALPVGARVVDVSVHVPTLLGGITSLAITLGVTASVNDMVMAEETLGTSTYILFGKPATGTSLPAGGFSSDVYCHLTSTGGNLGDVTGLTSGIEFTIMYRIADFDATL